MKVLVIQKLYLFVCLDWFMHMINEINLFVCFDWFMHMVNEINLFMCFDWFMHMVNEINFTASVVCCARQTFRFMCLFLFYNVVYHI
jgi:hypothetical protein